MLFSLLNGIKAWSSSTARVCPHFPWLQYKWRWPYNFLVLKLLIFRHHVTLASLGSATPVTTLSPRRHPCTSWTQIFCLFLIDNLLASSFLLLITLFSLSPQYFLFPYPISKQLLFFFAPSPRLDFLKWTIVMSITNEIHLKILWLFFTYSPLPWFYILGLSKDAREKSQSHDINLSYKFMLFLLCLNNNLILFV